MSYSDDEWCIWEPCRLFEQNLNDPRFAHIHTGDSFQRQGYPDRAILIYDEVAKNGASIGDLDLEACAEIHRSEAHRSLGQWDDAIKYYQRALRCFHLMEQWHNVGVTEWLIGLCYQALHNDSKALEHYDHAQEQFKELCSRNNEQGNRLKATKYYAWCEEMYLLLSHARAMHQAAEKRSVWKERIWTKEEYEEVPVFNAKLAAGEGVNLDDLPPTGQVQIGTLVCLNGKEYVLRHLKDKSCLVTLSPNYLHWVMQIVGNSMDLAGIDDQDYVLLRRSELVSFTPQNGDIIAAAVHDIPIEQGILKRYHRNGYIIRLESESSEKDRPEHRTREYQADSENIERQFRPIGQAVAVLKERHKP